MKRILLFIVAIVAVAAGSAPAAEVAGKWDVLVQMPGGQSARIHVTLVNEGGRLSGTMQGPAGAYPLQDVKLEGDQLSFKAPLGAGAFDIQVTVSGDSMKGTFTGPGGAGGTFEGTRVAAPAAAPGAKNKIDTGMLEGSAYRIDIPPNYTGTLILYCHAFGADFQLDAAQALPPGLAMFTGAGFAVAQAGYRSQGWAVEDAIRDTEALRRHFVLTHGRPKRIVVSGHSMGGLAALALVETYPLRYDAALPLCGPLGPSLEVLQRSVFDRLVIVDFYYPGAIGSPVQISPKVRLATEYGEELQKVFDEDLEKRRALAAALGLNTEYELGLVAGLLANIEKEVIARAGGNPFDNRNTIYTGTADDVGINRGAKRYPADPKAAAYVKKYYTPTGKLTKPVLAIHNVYDPVIPAWTSNLYGEIVRRNGSEKFFVQRYVPHMGHCVVKPEESMNGLRDLLLWQQTGKQPPPGEQQAELRSEKRAR